MLTILLVNLGTPEAPTASALKTYLAEFLSDPCVVDLPRLLWQPILRGIILKTRPAKSARLYQKIWLAEGSPLLVYSQKLADKLQDQLQQHYHTNDLQVILAMRYGKPDLARAFEYIKQSKTTKLIVLPMYPQYAEASSGSSLLHCRQLSKTLDKNVKLYGISDYYNHPAYITAMAQQISKYRQHPHLIFSFHGIPQKCVDRGSPYYEHCLTSAQLIADALGLSQQQWQLAFQSRFGPATWLQPYCDQVLKKLATDGIDHVDIVCPGFAVDCLETLEEIAQSYQEVFQEAGGKTLNYIPALNDSNAHVDCLANVIQSLSITS
ncbi:MAG: ferrochelatase [Pseudomonadota bacterium]